MSAAGTGNVAVGVGLNLSFACWYSDNRMSGSAPLDYLRLHPCVRPVRPTRGGANEHRDDMSRFLSIDSGRWWVTRNDEVACESAESCREVVWMAVAQMQIALEQVRRPPRPWLIPHHSQLVRFSYFLQRDSCVFFFCFRFDLTTSTAQG